MDPEALVAVWELTAPVTLRPVGSGTNNHTQYVDTPAGTYVLRNRGRRLVSLPGVLLARPRSLL
jgi:hypothetical protein